MDNNYSLKYNKYQQKYLVSQSGGYRDDYSRRGGYEGGYRDDYSRRGSYNGGNLFRRRDSINDLVKQHIGRDKWDIQNVKETKHLFDDTHGYQTYRYNWTGIKGPDYIYVVSYENNPIAYHLIECRLSSDNNGSERCLRKYETNQYDNIYEIVGYEDFNNYITGEIQKVHQIMSTTYYNRGTHITKTMYDALSSRGGNGRYSNNYDNRLNKEFGDSYFTPRVGGYDGSEYRDDYYPRSRYNGGRYDRYRDDYYPNSMHGGALGEFRKEINREI
jgi:hypothetical protein